MNILIKNIKYTVIGSLLGIVFVKSEVISWFRIQEMFRLQSFHMYGVLMTAIAVGMISIFLIKKFEIKAMNGEVVKAQAKPFQKGVIYGGTLFGIGWALTGACPGPLYALAGAGYNAIWLVIASAFVGVLTYGVLKPRLPH